MAQQQTTEAAATVIIGQLVRSGSEAAFETWQNDLNRAAATYPGFLGAEVTKPSGQQLEWVVVYRFDSVANLQNWLNSRTRQEHLDEGKAYLDGPATQQVVAGGSQPADPLVTVVVSHRVRDEDVDEFLAWQDRVLQAESEFPGFAGSEMFKPVEGVQDEWTMLYRYDNAESLDKWLTSDRRKQLLAEGSRFADFQLRTVDNSFGSWFAFDQNGKPAPPPSEVKSALAVWMGLYPTVVILTLALSPLKMPLWLGLLVGNLISSFVMSFFTMGRYVNPLLGWWMRPKPDADQPATNIKGLLAVLAINAIWVVIFYLMTIVFWTLP